MAPTAVRVGRTSLADMMFNLVLRLTGATVTSPAEPGPASRLRSWRSALPGPWVTRRAPRSGTDQASITCSIVHWRGALSGRQRRNSCRGGSGRRVKWSYSTSTTSSVERLPFAGALGAPAARPAGARPVKPGAFASGSSCRVSAVRSRRAKLDVKPTWWSSPSSSYRPSSSEPTTRALRGVAEAADHAVRRAHALDLLHAGALAGAVGEVDALGDRRRRGRRRAVRASARRRARVARRRREPDARRRRRSALRREALERRAALARAAARRATCRARPRADRRRRKQRRVLAARASATRLAAGWMRCSRSSNDSALADRDDDLAVEHEPSGAGSARKRVDDLGEIAVERLARLSTAARPSSPS